MHRPVTPTEFCPLSEVAGRLRAQTRAQLNASDAPAGLRRATVVLPPISPLDWLSRYRGALRFYGATRDVQQSLTIGGLDVAHACVWTKPVSYADVFHALADHLAAAAPRIRYYGGFRFEPDQTPDADWAAFGVARFIVPRFELITAPQASQLSLHWTRDDAETGRLEEALQRLHSMRFENADQPPLFLPPVRRVDQPAYAGWARNIEAALTDFEAGRLEKIVLARKAILDFEDEVDPIHLLRRLAVATPECYHFCFMPNPGTAFVGASPERLYFRDQHDLSSEAVAGTRMRSCDPKDDERLGRELLDSEKDQREHDFVREGIRSALAPLCEAVEMDQTPRLLKLARGQHLYSGVEGRLRAGVDDAAILEALHPTPALGGHPTAAARARITSLEGFDRGWYAGPVGWVSRDAAEFAVAIRSGLVHPRKVALFSGAGIVAGSTAENEWAEIELKIRDFIKVLTEG